MRYTVKDNRPKDPEGTLFMNGRSQAVRLPKAFRLPGKRVRVSREGNGIVLTPIIDDVNTWFAELDRLAGVDLMEEGRNQPPMPPSKDLFD